MSGVEDIMKAFVCGRQEWVDALEAERESTKRHLESNIAYNNTIALEFLNSKREWSFMKFSMVPRFDEKEIQYFMDHLKYTEYTDFSYWNAGFDYISFNGELDFLPVQPYRNKIAKIGRLINMMTGAPTAQIVLNEDLYSVLTDVLARHGLI